MPERYPTGRDRLAVRISRQDNDPERSAKLFRDGGRSKSLTQKSRARRPWAASRLPAAPASSKSPVPEPIRGNYFQKISLANRRPGLLGQALERYPTRRDRLVVKISRQNNNVERTARLCRDGFRSKGPFVNAAAWEPGPKVAGRVCWDLAFPTGSEVLETPRLWRTPRRRLRAKSCRAPAPRTFGSGPESRRGRFGLSAEEPFRRYWDLGGQGRRPGARPPAPGRGVRTFRQAPRSRPGSPGGSSPGPLRPASSGGIAKLARRRFAARVAKGLCRPRFGRGRNGGGAHCVRRAKNPVSSAPTATGGLKSSSPALRNRRVMWAWVG